MTFAQRLRTVRLSESAVPTRTRRKDWDAEQVDGLLPPVEQMLDETHGMGPVHADPRSPTGFSRVDPQTGAPQSVTPERAMRSLGLEVEG